MIKQKLTTQKATSAYNERKPRKLNNVELKKLEMAKFCNERCPNPNTPCEGTCKAWRKYEETFIKRKTK